MTAITVSVTDTPATDEGQWRMIATVLDDEHSLRMSRPVVPNVGWTEQATPLVEALGEAHRLLTTKPADRSIQSFLVVTRVAVTDGILIYQVTY